jgi:hypothetical protein
MGYRVVLEQRQAFPGDRNVRFNLYSIKCTLSTESLKLKPLHKVERLFVLKSELVKRSCRHIYRQRQAGRQIAARRQGDSQTETDRQTDALRNRQNRHIHYETKR